MSFDNIKNKLGFGCMRLQMTGDTVDYAEFNRMIDAFMEAGFNYFDTAHGYIDGKSETAIRDCLAARYKREDYVLADKLSDWYFEKEEDILPLFESQLRLCGVEYFDFYLFHCLTRTSYPKHLACHSFDILQKLKEQGKIKHIAMSFHDTADVLDRILAEQPCIEAVQLQLNYLDYDDPGVQSQACYEVAVKHGKKVIVMEPVRGGLLADLPDKAKAVLAARGDGSCASYALRYAASHPAVFMVLSGMGNMAMMKDNLHTFMNFVPFEKEDYEATARVREILRETWQIPCTGCRYCTEVCPKNIPIPELFAIRNKVLAAKLTAGQAKEAFPQDKGAAADCMQCGKCEGVCPQGIAIRQELEKIAAM